MNVALTYGTVLCAVLAAGMAAGALILNPRAPLNRAVALNGILLAVWAFGAGLFSLAANSEQAWLAYRIGSIGSLLNAPSVIWFFLSFSAVPLTRKILTAFPFYLINGSLLVATWTGSVWYSDFVPSTVGMTGIPTNPGAWVMFYVIVALYVWSFYYFCSRAGYASERLSWLGRRFRTMVIVSVSVYVLTLGVEGVFGWPDFSGLAYGIAAGTWVYQMFRYGFLSARPMLPALDRVLSLDVPLALVNPQGLIERANAAFAKVVGQPPQACAGQSLGTVFADESTDQALSASVKQKHEVQVSTKRGNTAVTLTLTPSIDEFGDLTGVTVLARVEDLWIRVAKNHGLSEREQQIAVLVAQGLTTGEIARQMFLAPATVRVHLFHIYEKTGARNRGELIRLWSDA